MNKILQLSLLSVVFVTAYAVSPVKLWPKTAAPGAQSTKAATAPSTTKAPEQNKKLITPF